MTREELQEATRVILQTAINSGLSHSEIVACFVHPAASVTALYTIQNNLDLTTMADGLNHELDLLLAGYFNAYRQQLSN